jgi:hypothetical protein
MAQTQTQTLIYKLVGPYAGQTVAFSKGRFAFKNGLMELEVKASKAGTSHEGLTRILGRYYNAHPVGSEALKAAEAVWEQEHGKRGQKAEARKAEPKPAAGSNEPAPAEGGGEEHLSDEGDAVDSGAGATDVPAKGLAKILRKLDPKKDKHWTTSGLPSLKAVADMAGHEVSRDEIEEAAPGLTRETA